MKHILTADQFSTDDLADLVQKALYHQTATNQPKGSVAPIPADVPKWGYNLWGDGWFPRHTVGKILVNLFYEPSSRTYASFHSAMVRLGGNVIPIQEAGTYSSAVKGESLEDTIRTMQCYGEVIVLRHKENGAAQRAAAVAEVPIINAGDGTGEHPTQALLDFFTILMERGWTSNQSIEECLRGLTITMLGDLKHGRTVKSLSILLRKYGVKINWVSPKDFRIPSQYFVVGNDREFEDLNEIIDKTDILYVVRTQLERIKLDVGHKVILTVPSLMSIYGDGIHEIVAPDIGDTFRMINENGQSFIAHQDHCKLVLDFEYGLTKSHMAQAKPDMILMHPLPRVTELPTELDTDSRSAYFRQMRYGLFMRMAVLETVLV